MSYKELQIESVIDDEVINEETMNFIYQMTELKKKKKIINTPINDVFKNFDMRNIIFGFKRQILEDFESIKQKVIDTRKNLKWTTMNDLKIGERYYDYTQDKNVNVYQVFKKTEKSVMSYLVESVEIPVPQFGLFYNNKYYKYTDKLSTKKQTKRKTTYVQTYKNKDMEIWAD